MFKLELDYVLRFVPPMTEHSGGIVFTRTIELPFPPFEKLHLFARDLDDCPYPPGLELKDVCWDMDRGCFLATTELIVHGPVAEIPSLLSSLRERGWRPGSFEDRYHGDDDQDDDLVADDDHEDDRNAVDFDELERLEQESPRKRPKKLNQLIKSLVRAMVDAGDDSAAAYALDKTGLVYTEREAHRSKNERAQAWIRAYREHDGLSDAELRSWRRKVRRYRNIQRIEPWTL